MRAWGLRFFGAVDYGNLWGIREERDGEILNLGRRVQDDRRKAKAWSKRKKEGSLTNTTFGMTTKGYRRKRKQENADPSLTACSG
jgi:hypothetical protein